MLHPEHLDCIAMRISRDTTMIKCLPHLLVILVGLCSECSNSLENQYEESACDLLRSRGYHAEEHQVTTQDGYILRLTRATNPLINEGKCGHPDREPLLFIHGAKETSSIFLVNSRDASPKDYSATNFTIMSAKMLLKLVGNDGASRSLPMLAMNFGHEVWLLNRRGTPGSRSRVNDESNKTVDADNVLQQIEMMNLPKAMYKDISHELLALQFNKGFWNYSLDEQAIYDVPNTIDYVLEKTRRSKLSIVGHSAGGSITLMAMSMLPEINNKVNKAALLAEAFTLGYDNDLFVQINKIPFARELVTAYIGPFPAVMLNPILVVYMRTICALDPFNCGKITGFGFTGGPQEPLKQEYLSSLLDLISSHEAAHLLQSAALGVTLRFDYGNLTQNIKAYGQATPPRYDLSKVTNRNLHFFVGVNDTIVTPADVDKTVGNLTVPYRLNTIGGNGVSFGHDGFFFHLDNVRLANIPALKALN